MDRVMAFFRLIPYWLLFWPAWLYFRYICQGCIENENIIKGLRDKGFIIAANHVSYFDWIVLHVYFRIKHDIKITFFAKTKVLNHPFLGILAKGGRCIAIDKNKIVNNDRNRQILAGSKHFIIFPEGTRSGDGKLLKGRRGVVKIARMTDLPVIPVALIGFYEIWPRNQWLPGVNRLRIVFGEPCCTEKYEKDVTSIEDQTRCIMQKIAGLMGRVYEY